MKKVLFTIVTLAMLGTYSINAQVAWGLRLGLAKMTASLSADGESIEMQGKLGLEAGPVLYYSFGSNFYLNSGALFSYKSLVMSDESYTYSWEDKYNLIFLEIPLYLGYNFPINDKFSIYGQAGPYLGFKLNESNKYTETYEGQTTTETYDEKMLSNVDAGLALMGGINISRFKFEIGYKFGLANVANKDANGFWEGEPATVKLGALFLGCSCVF